MAKNRDGARRVTLVVLAAFLGALFSTPGMAKERRGADVVLVTKGGLEIRGELIAVKKNGQLLINNQDAEPMDIHNLASIRIQRKSQLALGILIGLAGGLGLGGAIENSEPSNGFAMRGMKGAAVAVGCLLMGTLIGAAAGVDTNIKTLARDEKEYQAIISQLRLKAKYPDYE